MKEKLTPYLKRLTGSLSISGQYCINKNEPLTATVYNDPLHEEEHEVVKGLVHKYTNRALIKVSYQCAAHCRFCTRIRQIGHPEGTLNTEEINNIVLYLQHHPEIDEVILSGGDPFYTAKLTHQLLEQIKTIDSIKVFRIGTRLPLQLPEAFSSEAIQQLLSLIDEISAGRPFYILLHINHPDELTPDALKAIALLRQHRVTLLSQSVFLLGINDNYNTLHQLYTQLHHIGVIPYYLYHCDAVKGIQHFSVDIEKEKEIATQLTAGLSGIACPTYVIDIEDGHGKIPVPLNFINDALGTITDFCNKQHKMQ